VRILFSPPFINYQLSSVLCLLSFVRRSLFVVRPPFPFLTVHLSSLDYIGHVYARTEGIAGVLVSDKEYPPRVAFSILNKILEEFLTRFSEEQWRPNAMVYPELKGYLEKYQDPKHADVIIGVQQQLDETKIILVSCEQ